LLQPLQVGNRVLWGMRLISSASPSGLMATTKKPSQKKRDVPNIAHTNAGLLDVFARTNIINQIGAFVSMLPRV
jgi:hypothetical protein